MKSLVRKCPRLWKTGALNQVHFWCGMQCLVVTKVQVVRWSTGDVMVQLLGCHRTRQPQALKVRGKVVVWVWYDGQMMVFLSQPMITSGGPGGHANCLFVRKRGPIVEEYFLTGGIFEGRRWVSFQMTSFMFV